MVRPTSCIMTTIGRMIVATFLLLWTTQLIFIFFRMSQTSDCAKTSTEIVSSWNPRVFIFHNFLTLEECDHLIGLAKPNMKLSRVIDDTTGRIKLSKNRTSTGSFLMRDEDKIVSSIEDKIALVTFVPKEHGETFQIIRYEVGQKFDGHQDYYNLTLNNNNGGHRVAAMLIYLTDVEAGGETVFPRALNQKFNLSDVSDCAKEGIVVKPKKGDALLFWTMTLAGEPDPYTYHGGCPVLRGEKWVASKFIHQYKYVL